MRHTEANFSPKRKPICLEANAAAELPALENLLSHRSHSAARLHAAFCSLGLNQLPTYPSSGVRDHCHFKKERQSSG